MCGVWYYGILDFLTHVRKLYRQQNDKTLPPHTHHRAGPVLVGLYVKEAERDLKNSES